VRPLLRLGEGSTKRKVGLNGFTKYLIVAVSSDGFGRRRRFNDGIFIHIMNLIA